MRVKLNESLKLAEDGIVTTPSTEPYYELFYGTGGHGGPYTSIDAAVAQAKRLLAGSHSERTIYVRERTDKGVGGYGKVVATVSKGAWDYNTNKLGDPDSITVRMGSNSPADRQFGVSPY